MHKTKINRALLSGVFVLPVALACFSAPAGADVTGNMAFTSDYVFRGLTQTWSKPAVQAGLDYSHSSGFYLGTWASSVSAKEYNNASMEWDFYAGYNGKINDDMGWGVGAIQVWYPGGYYDATGAGGGHEKYDTQEVNVSFNYKFLGLKYSHALTNLFGLNQYNYFSATDAGTIPTSNTKGSSYVEANINYEVMDKLVMGLHAGHQHVKNASAYSYTDYKISLNKELPKDYFGLNVGVAYTDTNANAGAWTAASGTELKYLGDKTWILSVAKTF